MDVVVSSKLFKTHGTYNDVVSEFKALVDELEARRIPFEREWPTERASDGSIRGYVILDLREWRIQKEMKKRS
jgi:hypothetical protein